jgi:hypothetical protein
VGGEGGPVRRFYPILVEMTAVNHADPASGALVFDVRQLTKIYRICEVEVHALRDVTLTLPERISVSISK